MEYWHLLLLFGVGAAAGMINVMAGGGSALTLPALIFLGLDSALANGTNRVAILIQNIFAILSFRQEKFSEFKLSFKMAAWTLPGGILGAVAAVKISDALFQQILAIILIGVILSMMFSPVNSKSQMERIQKTDSWLVYLALFGIGFYGGFIQVGVGFLLMAALFHLLKISLVKVNMHKVFIVFIYTIPVLLVFAWNGKIDWALGLSMAAGNSFGAWWAAKLSIKKGENLIRMVLFIAIFIIIMKLLKVF